MNHSYRAIVAPIARRQLFKPTNVKFDMLWFWYRSQRHARFSVSVAIRGYQRNLNRPVRKIQM